MANEHLTPPPPPTSPLLRKFREEMMVVVHYTRSMTDTLCKPILKKLHLTFLQGVVLYAIAAEEQININRLCHLLSVAQGNMSTLCKKLEQMGFVTRRHSSADERVVFLTLTEQGASAVNEIAEHFANLCEVAKDVEFRDVDHGVSGLYAFNRLLELLERHVASHVDDEPMIY